MDKLEKFFAQAFAWYFSRKALPYWCILVLDSGIVMGSMLVAHAINNGLMTTATNFVNILLALCFYTIFYLIGFRVFRTYQGVVRYSSFTDLFRIANAVLAGSVMVWLVRRFAHSDLLLEPISARDLLIGSLIAILLMWVVRILVKLAFDTKYLLSNSTNIMIFGTKEGGVSIAKSIRNQHPSPYYIRGFITNYADMMGHTLLNLPIIDNQDPKLWEFIDKNQVKIVLISPLVQDYFINECQKMIDNFIKKGVKIMMMPTEQEWDGKSDLTHNSLHEVSVEDLLPRKKIEVDLVAIGDRKSVV